MGHNAGNREMVEQRSKCNKKNEGDEAKRLQAKHKKEMINNNICKYWCCEFKESQTIMTFVELYKSELQIY